MGDYVKSISLFFGRSFSFKGSQVLAQQKREAAVEQPNAAAISTVRPTFEEEEEVTSGEPTEQVLTKEEGVSTGNSAGEGTSAPAQLTVQPNRVLCGVRK